MNCDGKRDVGGKRSRVHILFKLVFALLYDHNSRCAAYRQHASTTTPVGGEDVESPQYQST